MVIFMDILSRLSDADEWQAFLEHKLAQGNISRRDTDELKNFIENEEYLPIVRKIRNGESFDPPARKLISKSKADRKRAVYTFGRQESLVLKLVAFMLRDYDSVFAPNLYSFRNDRGVKRATEDILRIKDLDRRYVYKVDISDYFRSVDIELLLPGLEEILSDDRPLFLFIKGLLECPYAVVDGEVIEDRKGIMAGVPISAFLANVYLLSLDRYFYENKIPYMRYSDDIIVFARDEEQLGSCIEKIAQTLAERRLSVNPEKETVTKPGEKWEFLGFSYHMGVIDISDVSFEKLKAKMRRKTRALSRWASRKGASGERAASAFVRRFNAKLFDNPVYSELTWTRWFFPVINTDRTLKEIDAYMQECIRYLSTGKRTKAKYSCRYEDIKALGYRSLVNEYYRQKKEQL